MRVANSIKVSFLKGMEFETTWKAGKLDETNRLSAALKCSKQEGSSRCGGVAIRNDTFYDLHKNASKFARTKGGRAETLLAISNNWQPPATFFDGEHMEHAYVQTGQQYHQFKEGLLRT